jgi:hypothetical protein
MLIIGTLTVACLLTYVALGQVIPIFTPAVPNADATPRLSVDRCRSALTGRDGGDNDVAYEMRQLNALRWSWDARPLRIDYRTVAQSIHFRRRNGALTTVFYACQWRASGVVDWPFKPARG